MTTLKHLLIGLALIAAGFYLSGRFYPEGVPIHGNRLTQAFATADAPKQVFDTSTGHVQVCDDEDCIQMDPKRMVGPVWP